MEELRRVLLSMSQVPSIQNILEQHVSVADFIFSDAS